jgi:hypothetical protein
MSSPAPKTPTPQEVQTAIDEVVAQVVDLVSTEGGVELMQAAADAYVGHDE